MKLVNSANHILRTPFFEMHNSDYFPFTSFIQILNLDRVVLRATLVDRVVVLLQLLKNTPTWRLRSLESIILSLAFCNDDLNKMEPPSGELLPPKTSTEHSSLDENVLKSSLWIKQIPVSLMQLVVRDAESLTSFYTGLPQLHSVTGFFSHGASAWARSFRIDAELSDGSNQSYFMKVVLPLF